MKQQRLANVAKTYRSLFNIPFCNASGAHNTADGYPCPMTGPADCYPMRWANAVITEAQMRKVKDIFDAEMRHVPRKDNMEELRSSIVERLWTMFHGKNLVEKREDARLEREAKAELEFRNREKARERELKACAAEKERKRKRNEKQARVAKRIAREESLEEEAEEADHAEEEKPPFAFALGEIVFCLDSNILKWVVITSRSSSCDEMEFATDIAIDPGEAVYEIMWFDRDCFRTFCGESHLMKQDGRIQTDTGPDHGFPKPADWSSIRETGDIRRDDDESDDCGIVPE